MSSITFDKSRVDEAVDLLSSIGSDLSNISSELNSSIGKIINAKGFQEYVGGLSQGIVDQYVVSCEEVCNTIIANIVSKEVAILEYNGDDGAVSSVLNSLSPSILGIIGIDLSDISDDSSVEEDTASKNIFTRTAATVGTFGVSILEGLGGVVEAGVDLIDMGFTGLSTIFKAAGNIITGKSIGDGIEEMWERTSARVSEKKCESLFNSFYENNSLGKALKTNAYGFDTVRSIGTGVGYAGGVIGLTLLTAGTVSPLTLGVTAGSLGVAKGSEQAWSEGASVGRGLLYGAVNGVWEGAQWYVGGKINQISTGSSVASGLFKGAQGGVGIRVGLDTLTAASEGFVRPAMSMIYKDYGGDNIFESYGEAFEANGGWKSVGIQAAIGAIASAGSEVISGRRALASAKKAGAGGDSSSGSGGDSSGSSGDSSSSSGGDSSSSGGDSSSGSGGDSSGSGGNSKTNVSGGDSSSSGKTTGSSVDDAAKKIFKAESGPELMQRSKAVLGDSNVSLREVESVKSFVEREISSMSGGDTVSASGIPRQELEDALIQLRQKEVDISKSARNVLRSEASYDSALESQVKNGSAPEYSLGEKRSALPESEIKRRVSDMGIRTAQESSTISGEIEKMASRFGITPEQMRQELDAKIRSLVSDGEVGRRTGVSTLEKCLDSGYTKSQFETGSSGGYIGFGSDKYGVRASLEKSTFGLSADTPYVDRPVYGMMFPSGDAEMASYIRSGPGTFYGSGGSLSDKCVIIFNKDAISNSASITLGDSLDYKYSSFASPMSDPSFSGAFYDFASSCSSLDEFRKASLSNLFSGGDQYIECQLHGQASHAINSTNVKEVIFTTTPSSDLIQKLNSAGISWRIL